MFLTPFLNDLGGMLATKLKNNEKVHPATPAYPPTAPTHTTHTTHSPTHPRIYPPTYPTHCRA